MSVSDELNAKVRTLSTEELPGFSEEMSLMIYEYLVARLAASEKQLRIMVVDDEKIALDSMEHALNEEGYDVVTACNGAEAIERLKETTFDLVITDLIMGDVDGHDVLKEVHKICPDTRTIMITGYATVDTAVEAIRMGAFHYIEKPVRLDKLKSVVRDATGIGPAAKRTVLCLAVADEEIVSFGKKIADAANRNFFHISLNGIKNVSDITGISREDGGTSPGLLMKEMANTGSMDPVIVMENIDTVTPEVASCLADIMDPEKNRAFYDKYLGLPSDLSRSVFIVTAQNADNIHSPLNGLIETIAS